MFVVSVRGVLFYVGERGTQSLISTIQLLYNFEQHVVNLAHLKDFAGKQIFVTFKSPKALELFFWL